MTEPPPNELQARIAAIASTHHGGDPLAQPLPGVAKANVAGYFASGGTDFVAFVDQVARVDLAGGTFDCANLAGAATSAALDRMYAFVAAAPDESIGSPGASLVIDTQRLVAACNASDTVAMDEVVGRIAWEWSVVERWLRAIGATP